jgi:hypothetical protein
MEATARVPTLRLLVSDAGEAKMRIKAIGKASV